MTDILLIWLNTEVDLGKKIKNLEEDFSNGYNLGLLLYRFNQLTNFHEFTDKSDRDSKLKNFAIIERVLSNIKVNFDSNKARDIINKKRGAIALLLYQIRTKLEKKGISMENLSLKKSSHINELYQSKILGQKIEKYDKLNEKFFNQRLAAMLPAQKEIEMKKVLSRFEEQRKKYDDSLKNYREIIEKDKKVRRDDFREENKSKAQRVHAFNQMFEQKGIENWKKNMISKKKMEERDLDFQLKEAEKFQNLVLSAIKKSEFEVIKQIDNFENLLNNKPEEINDGNHQNNSGYLKVVESANEMVSKIMEKIMKNPVSKKERDRRRRKIIVEQMKAQLEIENIRREEQLISKLFKQSNQEKQLVFETYRVSQSKEIIIQNRFLRDELYELKSVMDIEFNEINQSKFLNSHLNKLDVILKKEEQRIYNLSVSLKQNIRSKNTDYCKRLVDMIIEITDEAYNYQQLNDTEEFDDRVWREWTQLFINNMSVKKDVYENNEDVKNMENFNTKDFFGKTGEIKHIVDGNEMNFSRENNESVDEKFNKSPKKELPVTGLELKISDKVDVIEKIDDNNSIIPSANQTNFATGFSNNQNTQLDKKLDEAELKDYINYLYQWDYNNIPKNNFIILNLAELINDADDSKNKNANKKTNLQKGKKDDEEFKEEDPENLEIPKSIVKNQLFGDLIDLLIHANFSEENDNNLENELKEKYSHIPIKIIMNGLPFCGKNTQAKILNEKYNLKELNIEHLVKSCLLELEKPDEDTELDNNKIGNLDDFEEKDKEDDDGVDIPKQKKINNLKEIALEIKNLLKEGKPIDDIIYVKIIEEYIKINFPFKNSGEILNEAINRNNARNELLKAKEIIKEEKDKRPNWYMNELKNIEEELKKLDREAIYGFCIVNFPYTYNQAKLLERKLNGYIPDNEKTKTLVEIYKEDSSLILDKSPQPEPLKVLIPSAVDLFIYLNTSTLEAARRSFGRKRDPNTNIEYHLQYNPPLIDENIGYICERLIPITDNENSESSFVTRCVSFENTIGLLKEFYEPFGFEAIQLKTWQEINGNSNPDTVNSDICKYIDKIIEHKNHLEEEMIEANQDYDLNITESNSSGESKLMEENLNENNDNDENSANDFADMKNDLKNINIDKIDKKKSNYDEAMEKYKEKVNFVKKQLSPELIDLLLKIWFRMFENYTRECKSIFKFIRKQRDYISTSYNSLCQKFIEFLKRPSKKQLHLLDYQVSYNNFLDEYPDIKDDPRVKEEHHQRVDDLSDKIYEIIEIRKVEAIEQRKKIMTSNWIENEMEKFYHNLERLFQVEIDKFLGSLQIIKDYYHGLDNRVLAEIPFYSVDIIKEEIDPTPIEKNISSQANISSTNANPNLNANKKDKNVEVKSTLNIFGQEDEFPRLEKLYKTALMVQYQYDEMLFKAEKERIRLLQEKEAKDKKTKPNVNVKDNKDNKDNKDVKEIKEVYPHEDEMKLSLKLEKAKFRGRITLLRHWGIQYIKNLRKQTDEIYSKLEDWIILAIKAENEALNQLCIILKKHIEDELKIKYELELDTFDVKINMDVINYVEEPPKLLPAKEIIDQNKFNIQQINILIGELSTYIVSNNNIRTSNFMKIFEKKFITSKTDNDVYYGLPGCLKKLSFQNFYKFIKCFDPNNTDFMNLQWVLTIFCILTSRVCSEKDEYELKNSAGPYLKEFVKLDRDSFVKLPMWFDDNETCPTIQGYEVFNRVDILKGIIFDINKDEDEMIDLFDLCDLFTLKKLYLGDIETLENRTYYEVLFF